MMFVNSLTKWLRKRNPSEKSSTRPNTRFQLEELEDRFVPATFNTDTLINPTISITPGFTVTEQITIQVTPFGTVSAPMPPTTTPPGGGIVVINLNNLQQQTATLNSNGQATFTFNVPLLAFLTSQTLEVAYSGFTDSSGDVYKESVFLAPIYKNFDNVMLPSTITFVQPTPQQLQTTMLNNTTSSLPPFNSVAGETNSILGGLVKFNYTDPGTIDTVSALGLQLPGIFAARLGAFNGFNIPIST